MRKLVIVAAAVTSLIGCSHIPNKMEAGYYLPKSDIRIKAIRTVACDANNNPIVATSVTPLVVHSADPAQHRTLSLDRFQGALSDADVKVDYFEDGRLKGINASTTGKGETILKTTTSLAQTLALMGIERPDTQKAVFDRECQFIKSAAGGDKPLSLTYEDGIDIGTGSAQEIRPEGGSLYYHANLIRALGVMLASVTGIQRPDYDQIGITPKDSESGIPGIKARQPGSVSLSVSASNNPIPLWEGKVPVAQVGREYTIPIPKAAVFGKQSFVVSFGESGALNNIQYVSNTGTGEALNAVSFIQAALQGDSTETKVKNVKAEADLIYQQQRLVQCKADPTTCK